MEENINLHFFSQDKIVLDYARAVDSVGLWESEKIIFNKYIKKENNILELGCGAGRVAFGLEKIGYKNITATDFSEEMIKIAKVIAESKSSNVHLKIEDATKLSFPDKQFDIVIFAFNGFQMIPKHERRITALYEIIRVLKPGGIFIWTGHDRTVPRRAEYWKTEKEIWAEKKEQLQLDDFGDYNHKTDNGNMFIHSADPNEIKKDLSDAGIKILQTLLRSEIAIESDIVQEFSDDTRFWVVQKKA